MKSLKCVMMFLFIFTLANLSIIQSSNAQETDEEINEEIESIGYIPTAENAVAEMMLQHAWRNAMNDYLDSLEGRVFRDTVNLPDDNCCGGYCCGGEDDTEDDNDDDNQFPGIANGRDAREHALQQQLQEVRFSVPVATFSSGAPDDSENPGTEGETPEIDVGEEERICLLKGQKIIKRFIKTIKAMSDQPDKQLDFISMINAHIQNHPYKEYLLQENFDRFADQSDTSLQDQIYEEMNQVYDAIRSYNSCKKSIR